MKTIKKENQIKSNRERFGEIILEEFEKQTGISLAEEHEDSNEAPEK